MVSKYDYYSYWSFALFVSSLVIYIVAMKLSPKLLSVVLGTMLTNSLAVGIVGAGILAYGIKNGSDTSKLLLSNFVLHAIPAFLTTALYVHTPLKIPRRSVIICICILSVIQILYLSIKSSCGSVGITKIENVYCDRPFLVMASFIVSQFVILNGLKE